DFNDGGETGVRRRSTQPTGDASGASAGADFRRAARLEYSCAGFSHRAEYSRNGDFPNRGRSAELRAAHGDGQFENFERAKWSAARRARFARLSTPGGQTAVADFVFAESVAAGYGELAPRFSVEFGGRGDDG